MAEAAKVMSEAMDVVTGAMKQREEFFRTFEPKSEAEQKELETLREMYPPPGTGPLGGDLIRVRAIEAPEVLNEAYHYASPASFSRGLRVDMLGITFLYISGTASVNEEGKSVYGGDFRAQTWRTFRNITTLLKAEGATWHDLVRTTCYLRDIERDYQDFNEIRTQFYREMGLDPLPASTGIQARLCREDLLVEIEAFAFIPNGSKG